MFMERTFLSEARPHSRKGRFRGVKKLGREREFGKNKGTGGDDKLFGYKSLWK
jgi:hypothetical protein